MVGKQGSMKSPRPNSLSFDASEYQLRWSEIMLNGDPSRGRRMSGSEYNWDKAILVKGFKNEYAKYSAIGKGVHGGKRQVWWLRRHMRSIIFTFLLLGFFFLLDSFMFSYFDPAFLKNVVTPTKAYAPKVYTTV